MLYVCALRFCQQVHWHWRWAMLCSHYNDVIMSVMATRITSLTIVYSTVYSGEDQGKHQSSVSLALVRGIHWWPVNSLHKWPVTRKMFPFDNVIRMILHKTCSGSGSDTYFSVQKLENQMLQFTWHLKFFMWPEGVIYVKLSKIKINLNLTTWQVRQPLQPTYVAWHQKFLGNILRYMIHSPTLRMGFSLYGNVKLSDAYFCL